MQQIETSLKKHCSPLLKRHTHTTLILLKMHIQSESVVELDSSDTPLIDRWADPGSFPHSDWTLDMNCCHERDPYASEVSVTGDLKRSACFLLLPQLLN